MAVPAAFNGAWVLLPMNALWRWLPVSCASSVLITIEIWKFSPFNYLSVLRWLRRTEPRPSFSDWQMVFLSAF